MKTRTQRIISLVLVLVMLVTMIPAGIFTANAEVSAELVAGLAAYDSTPEFVINTTDDWAEVAASEKDFAGKTVKLGADISGVTAPLAATFAGIFDGQNFKIKDSTVTGDGVIATVLAAGATVKNVKFENVDLTGTNTVGMIAGVITPSGTTTIEKINVDADSSVTGAAKVGGLLGQVKDASNYMLNISNVSIQAAITATGEMAGGLIGEEGNRAATTANKGHIVVTDALISPASMSATKLTGGVIGGYTMGKNTTAKEDGTTKTASTVSSLKVTNVAVVGEYTNAITGESKASTGFNVYYTNLYVTVGVDQSIVDGDSYASSLNGYHTTYAVTGGRYNVSIDDITSKGILTEVPHIVDATVLLNFVVRDENGYVSGIEPVDPSTCEHSYSEFVIVTPATKESEGLKKKNCTKCGHEFTAVISKIENYYTADDFLAMYEGGIPTFEISSDAEWNALASIGKDFNGKTIILGDNIDFKNDVALPLVPASLGATTVKFDGKGYTIKNATASAPLIAGILTAKEIGASDASVEFSAATTIKNVTFEKITMKSNEDVALVVGKLGDGTNAKDYIFENIKIIDCDITSTEGNAAALVANYVSGTVNKGTLVASNLKFINVTIDADTNITGGNHAAGILADATGNTTMGFVFENVYVAATIKSVHIYPTMDDPNTEANENTAHETSEGRVGGLVASAGPKNERKASCSFKNVAVVGSLLTENGMVDDGTLGGLFGYVGNVSTFTVENVVIDLVEFTAKQNYRYALAMMGGEGAVITYKNLYVGNAPKEEFMCASAHKVFETDCEAHTTPVGTELPNVGVIDPERHESLITMENGFVTAVKDIVSTEAYQTSAVTEDGKYAIRFIATVQAWALEGLNMKVVATVTDADGTVKTVKTFDTAELEEPGCTLYDGLTVYEDYGINGKTGETVYANDIGAVRLAAFTIYNVPAEYAISFEVTTYYSFGTYGYEVSTSPMKCKIPAGGPVIEAQN